MDDGTIANLALDCFLQGQRKLVKKNIQTHSVVSDDTIQGKNDRVTVTKLLSSKILHTSWKGSNSNDMVMGHQT